MRLFIDKGWLIETREITDSDGNRYTDRSGEPYLCLLAFQVFTEAGDPAERSYRGVGEIHGQKIFLGDPQTTTNLIEGRLAAQPTSESWDHYAGYKEAITAPRQLSTKQYQKKVYGVTRAWEEGYQQGYAERKMRGVKREAF
jgi:hypothetical protein